MTAVLTTIDELRRARAELPEPVVTVMTMGALHDGHLALVRRAREIAGEGGSVILTDFVNPLQFGPGEDFEAYPRDLEADVALVGDLADLVFAPAAQEMYPVWPPAITVDVGALGTVLEGAARPGHFAGVATVVLKLLHLTAPEVAVFGRKDAQQLAIIRRLVADLDVPVRIEAVPIQREASGLARSSRNAYLSDRGREQALALSRTIAAVEAAAGDLEGVLAALASERDADGVSWDYATAVDPRTLAPIDPEHRGTVIEALIVLAARVEGTRLLDTTTVAIGPIDPTVAEPTAP